MKSHWLITILLLLATGCKAQQPEPLAIKVKPLPDETIGSSTLVTLPKTASNASITKAATRSSPNTSPSPKASPTAKTTTSASEAVLTATNPKSRINFRSTPSTSSKRLGYGTVGERVQVVEQKAGTDGSTWYKVRFPRSGTQGWIRKDFIKVTAKQSPSKSGVPSASPSSSNKPSPKNSKPTP